MEMTVMIVAEALFFPFGNRGGGRVIIERPIPRDKKFKKGGLIVFRAVNSENDIVAEEKCEINNIIAVDGITNVITLEITPLS